MQTFIRDPNRPNMTEFTPSFDTNHHSMRVLTDSPYVEVHPTFTHIGLRRHGEVAGSVRVHAPWGMRAYCPLCGNSDVRFERPPYMFCRSCSLHTTGVGGSVNRWGAVREDPTMPVYVVMYTQFARWAGLVLGPWPTYENGEPMSEYDAQERARSRSMADDAVDGMRTDIPEAEWYVPYGVLERAYDTAFDAWCAEQDRIREEREAEARRLRAEREQREQEERERAHRRLMAVVFPTEADEYTSPTYGTTSNGDAEDRGMREDDDDDAEEEEDSDEYSSSGARSSQPTGHVPAHDDGLYFHDGAACADMPSTRHVGVEIEVASSRTNLRDTARVLFGTSWRGLNFTGDGSLPSTGVEIVTPPSSGTAFASNILKLTAMLAMYGTRVDRSCGLHVHVDGRGLDRFALRRLMLLWCEVEEHVFHMMPPSRRTNHYCQPLRENVKGAKVRESPLQSGKPVTEAVDRAVYGTTEAEDDRLSSRKRSKYDSARYYAMNMHSWFYRGTVEFRCAAGTTNPSKILPWAAFCVGLVDIAADPELCTTVMRRISRATHPCAKLMAATVKDAKKVRTYIRERWNLFASSRDRYTGKMPVVKGPRHTPTVTVTEPVSVAAEPEPHVYRPSMDTLTTEQFNTTLNATPPVPVPVSGPVLRTYPLLRGRPMYHTVDRPVYRYHTYDPVRDMYVYREYSAIDRSPAEMRTRRDEARSAYASSVSDYNETVPSEYHLPTN